MILYFWEIQKNLLPFQKKSLLFFLVQKREGVSLQPPPSCSAVVNFSVQTIESRRFVAGRDSTGGSARQKMKTLPGTHWLKSGSNGHLVSSQPNPSVWTKKFFGICSISLLPLSCVETHRGRNSLWQIPLLTVWTNFSQVEKNKHTIWKIVWFSLSLDNWPLFGVSFGGLFFWGSGWISLKKEAKMYYISS